MSDSAKRIAQRANRAIDAMCEKMNPDLQKSLQESMTQQREAFNQAIAIRSIINIISVELPIIKNLTESLRRDTAS